MNLLENLKWRYATKKMDGTSIDPIKVEQILETTRYAASSFGLQPYHILVIKDHETRKKLLNVSYNQSQIVDCSHLLVFCIWSDITLTEIEDFIQDIATKRGMPLEALQDYKAQISNSILGLSVEAKNNWSAKQAYIALGTALAAAAEAKVDSTPMEGFDAAAYDEILGLKQKGLKSVVLLALGQRDASGDWLAGLPKVRRDLNLLTETI